MKSFGRIIFIQNGMKDGKGHWIHEILGLRGAVRSSGMECVILAHSDCDRALVAEHDVIPAIPFLPLQTAVSAPGMGRLSSFVEFPQAFASSLSEHLPADISHRDLLHVCFSSEVELFGTARWLREQSPERRPSVSFSFQDLPHEWRVNPETLQIEGNFAFWKHAVWSLRQCLDEERIRVFGSCPALALMLEKLLGMPCGVLPSATQFRREYAAASPEKRYDVATIGGNRSDQGVLQWAEILSALRAMRPGVTVSFQMMRPHQREAMIRRFGKLYDPSQVEIAVGTQDTREYYARMQASRLLLLCYAPERYCFRDSGVFVEANCLGIPTVAHARTSMGRRIMAGMAAGSVYGSGDPREMASVIHRSLEQIEELDRKGASQREAWIKAYSPETSLGMILGSFGAEKIPGPRPEQGASAATAGTLPG